MKLSPPVVTGFYLQCFLWEEMCRFLQRMYDIGLHLKCAYYMNTTMGFRIPLIGKSSMTFHHLKLK